MCALRLQTCNDIYIFVYSMNNIIISFGNLYRTNNCHISDISYEEKIVWISPLCWEWVAVQEREADHEHDG